MNAKKILCLAALLALVATTATAGPRPQRGWSKQITLEPTDYGIPLEAKALATIGSKNGVEYFGIRLFCTEEDGTVMTVYADDASGVPFMVGTMEMFLGSASLYMESSKVPSDLFPVTELRNIWIEYDGEVMVNGSF